MKLIQILDLIHTLSQKISYCDTYTTTKAIYQISEFYIQLSIMASIRNEEKYA